MTVTVEIRYINGRAHGTPWGSSHNEGHVEFPPSPLRIYRALVATWFERARDDVAETEVRSLIATLVASPPTYTVPRFSSAHTRHYLPESSHKEGVDRATAKVLNGFVAVCDSTPLSITWEVSLTDAERGALTTLAAQLPYLGRAESLVEATVVDGVTAIESARVVAPGTAADLSERQIRLLSPTVPLDFDSLLVVPWKERAKGYVLPRGSERVSYAADRALTWPHTSPVVDRRPPVEVIEWRLRGRGQISITAAVAYCDVLRQAVLRQFNGVDPDVLRRLFGKGADDQKSLAHHTHSHFLPLPDKSGLFLDGLAMWMPPSDSRGLSPDHADLATKLTRLFSHDSDVRPVRLYLQGHGSARDSALPTFGASKVWRTLTPYAPARHLRTDRRKDVSLEREVTRELEERGIQAPASVEVLERSGDIHPLDFRRHRIPRKEFLRDARRAFHVRLTFDEPVHGPIAIGALSHFGLGTFVPESLHSERTTLGL